MAREWQWFEMLNLVQSCQGSEDIFSAEDYVKCLRVTTADAVDGAFSSARQEHTV